MRSNILRLHFFVLQYTFLCSRVYAIKGLEVLICATSVVCLSAVSCPYRSAS